MSLRVLGLCYIWGLDLSVSDLTDNDVFPLEEFLANDVSSFALLSFDYVGLLTVVYVVEVYLNQSKFLKIYDNSNEKDPYRTSQHPQKLESRFLLILASLHNRLIKCPLLSV